MYKYLKAHTQLFEVHVSSVAEAFLIGLLALPDRPFFPKQLNVGVFNCLLRGVRLFSGGGVRLSGVSQFICLSVFACLRSFVSLSGWWCPAFWMSVFTCLPSFVPLSGWWCPALWMSVFTCLPSFTCRSGWWCPALWMCLHSSPVSFHLSPWLVVSGSLAVCICLSSLAFHLSAGVAGGVLLFGCVSTCLLPFVSHLARGVLLFGCVFTCLLPFVPQSGWWCRALWVRVFTCLDASGSVDVSQFMCLPAWLVASGSLDVCLHLPPSICLPLAGAALHGWWCPISRLHSSFVSLHVSPTVCQSSWWCPRLCPFICLPAWLAVSGSLMSVFICLPSFVSQSGWPFVCLPLWFMVACSSDVCLHLSLSLAGGVRLFGCLSSLVSVHVSPCLAGGIWLCGCLSSHVSLHVSATALRMSFFTCLPSLVSLSGWLCPALWMSVFTC